MREFLCLDALTLSGPMKKQANSLIAALVQHSLNFDRVDRTQIFERSI